MGDCYDNALRLRRRNRVEAVRFMRGMHRVIIHHNFGPYCASAESISDSIGGQKRGLRVRPSTLTDLPEILLI